MSASIDHCPKADRRKTTQSGRSASDPLLPSSQNDAPPRSGHQLGPHYSFSLCQTRAFLLRVAPGQVRGFAGGRGTGVPYPLTFRSVLTGGAKGATADLQPTVMICVGTKAGRSHLSKSGLSLLADAERRQMCGRSRDECHGAKYPSARRSATTPYTPRDTFRVRTRPTRCVDR